MSSKIESRILKALETKKLNPNKLGGRNWYDYFITINELVWARNLKDGYEIHVYNNSSKSEHLETIII